MARQIIEPHFGDRIVYAYRMTHIDNIPYILNKGFVLPYSDEASSNYVNIGDKNVIAKRKERNVQGYILSEFIPFYFGPRSPMLYVLQCGGNGVKIQSPENIVYCVVKISDLINQNVDCMFTDGHALDVLSTYFPAIELPNINKYISIDDVYEKFWRDEESDIDLKRRKEAELLVRGSLPPTLIAGLIVFNEETKRRLLGQGVTKKIMVYPTFYF